MKALIIAVLGVGLAAGSAAAQEPDVAAGESAFRKCEACHAVGEHAINRMGPVLNDVFGRKAGVYPGYSYSQVMVDAGASGLTWTAETLDKYIAAPKDFLPGTKMAFIGVKKDDERANIIAYLQTLSPDYVPPAE